MLDQTAAETRSKFADMASQELEAIIQKPLTPPSRRSASGTTQGDIARLFDGLVDVVSRDGLKPYVRPATTAEAVYAF